MDSGSEQKLNSDAGLINSNCNLPHLPVLSRFRCFTLCGMALSMSHAEPICPRQKLAYMEN